MIGPISGDMSMAPMITAVELVLRPSDAMSMANTRMRMFVPLKLTPSRMLCSASSSGTRYPFSEKYPAREALIWLKILFAILKSG